MPSSRARVGDQIRSPRMRVIGEDGANLGEMSRREALDLAAEHELDLVEVSPDARPPVAKLMNYSREKFRAEREARKKRSHDNSHEVKEVQIRPTTDIHDLTTKATAATKFLMKGHRVRVVVRSRGRLQSRPEMAEATLERFYALIEPAFVQEHRSAAGDRISVVLKPEGPVKERPESPKSA